MPTPTPSFSVNAISFYRPIFCYKRRFWNSVIREPACLLRKWYMTQRYLHQYLIINIKKRKKKTKVKKKKKKREALHKLEMNTLIVLRNVMLGKQLEACCLTLDTGFGFPPSSSFLLYLFFYSFLFIFYVIFFLLFVLLSLSFPFSSPVFFRFLCVSTLSHIQVPKNSCEREVRKN